MYIYNINYNCSLKQYVGLYRFVTEDSAVPEKKPARRQQPPWRMVYLGQPQPLQRQLLEPLERQLPEPLQHRLPQPLQLQAHSRRVAVGTQGIVFTIAIVAITDADSMVKTVMAAEVWLMFRLHFEFVSKQIKASPMNVVQSFFRSS